MMKNAGTTKAPVVDDGGDGDAEVAIGIDARPPGRAGQLSVPTRDAEGEPLRSRRQGPGQPSTHRPAQRDGDHHPLAPTNERGARIAQQDEPEDGREGLTDRQRQERERGVRPGERPLAGERDGGDAEQDRVRTLR